MRYVSKRLPIGVAALATLLVAGPAEAVSFNFDTQANLVQASPFPQNKQNEPSIAQNPTDPQNLISASNDEIDEPACTARGCSFVPNVGLSGVYVSHNGGASWTQFSAQAGGDNTASNNGGLIHTLPGFGKLARDLGIPGLASDGDPSLAFSRGGVAFYASLAGVRPASNSELMTVSRSTNGGATWSNPVLATDATNPVDFNDKEAIWVDKSASSPFADNVYVSWTLFVGPKGRAEPIVFSRSTDGGRTFSPAIKLSASFNNNVLPGRQGSVIRTAPNGDVYVVWESVVVDQGAKFDAQVFAKSTDGGRTFSRPAVISPVTPVPNPLPGSSFRTDSFPSVDIGPNGTVYVSWSDFGSGHGQVLLSKSSDGGATWTPAALALDVAGRSTFFPGVAVSPDGTKLSVAAQALDAVAASTKPGAGVVHYDSYVAESIKGGPFSSALKISTASSDPDGSSTNSLGAQFQGDYNTLISDNTSAWFIWTDARGASPCTAVDLFRAGTPPKPSVPANCPASFGNTDIFVGRVSL
jgi:hypothetical protein